MVIPTDDASLKFGLYTYETYLGTQMPRISQIKTSAKLAKSAHTGPYRACQNKDLQ
jgi:hypothetical protein